MGVFDYARNKIKKEYRSRYDYSSADVKRHEKIDLDEIDWYEIYAKQGFKDAITYRLKAFWRAQTDDEKLFIGCGIAVIVFAFYACLIWSDNTPLNIIILNVSEGFFFCSVVLGIIWIYRIISKKLIKRRIFYIVWGLFFTLSIPHIPVLFKYETTQIDDFYEAREYTENYYVIYSKKPQSNTDRKQYMLPAQIERRYDYLGTTDDGYDMLDLNYHINYLYFSNGGYLSFDYDGAYEDPSYSTVILGQEVAVIDSHGDTYYVTLTDEKVER